MFHGGRFLLFLFYFPFLIWESASMGGVWALRHGPYGAVSLMGHQERIQY